MDLKLISASTSQPITLSDAKDHLQITSNRWDTQIERKIKAATEFCQRRIGGWRQFMEATYEAIFSEFPDRIEVPIPPLKQLVSLKYYDSDGTLQTLASTASSTAVIEVKPTDDPAYYEPAYGTTWPDTRARPDAVAVRFKAGYASQSDVPETIKEAVRLKLEHLWDPERVSEPDMRRAVDDLLGCNEYGCYS